MALAAFAAVVAAVFALGLGESDRASTRTGAGSTSTPVNPYDEEYGWFTPVTASGRTASTIPMPAGARAGIITATYLGSAMFDVGYVHGSGATALLNYAGVTGPYRGSVPFGIYHEPREDVLTVWASEGWWQVTIAPVSSAAEMPAAISSRKDAVFLYSGGGGEWVFTRAVGSRRLHIVQQMSSAYGLGRDWTIVGSTTVRFAAGPSVVAVSADGAWSAAAK